MAQRRSAPSGPAAPRLAGVLQRMNVASFLDELTGYANYAKLEQVLVGHITGSSDASDVLCFISYDTSKKDGWVQVKGSGADVKFDYTLSKCKDKKQPCEHSVSSGDGEVLLLSAAMKKLTTDGKPSNTVVLGGPYGACDGCKERILKFIADWQEASSQAATLTVHYVYGAVFKQTRQGIKTVYGDDSDPFVKGGQKKNQYTLYAHTWGPVSGAN